MCITLRSQVLHNFSKTARCASHRRVKLRSVHYTAKSSAPNFSKNCVVCITAKSQALRCASPSCHGVRLRGVHPTTESNCTLRSQIRKFRWSLVAFKVLKGQSGEILLGVNTSIMKEKIGRTHFWFATPKFLTPLCHAHCDVEFSELCDRISRRNWYRTRKYFSLFIRGPDRFELWKKWRLKILWHTPFKLYISMIHKSAES